MMIKLLFAFFILIIAKESGKDQIGREHFDKIHEKAQIIHDIDDNMEMPKKELTDLEQDTYFFKLHDFDGNNLLDGVELMKAYLHEPTPDGKRLSDEVLEYSIDYVLAKADLNGDRYLDFSEFRKFTTSHAKGYGY